jgi:hypothetical protein
MPNIGHYSPAAKLATDLCARWRMPEVWPGRGHIRAQRVIRQVDSKAGLCGALCSGCDKRWLSYVLMVDPHRSRKIEYELLRMVVQCQDHLGYHATLGNLALFFRPNIPDIENRELVEALKRLRPKYLALCKYVSGGPSCQEYPTQIDDDEIFFWRGDGFRMRRTPETALRSEELSSLWSISSDRPDLLAWKGSVWISSNLICSKVASVGWVAQWISRKRPGSGFA